MKYFTSDLHLGHSNIIESCNRPFASVEDMNDTLFSNFKYVLKSGDILYILGDFAFDKVVGAKFLDYFKTKGVCVHLILGNHDSENMQVCFQNYLTTMTIRKKVKIIGYGHSLLLDHYPLFQGKNRYQLHGHLHNDDTGDKCHINVGVDKHEFFPISEIEILKIIRYRENN